VPAAAEETVPSPDRFTRLPLASYPRLVGVGSAQLLRISVELTARNRVRLSALKASIRSSSWRPPRWLLVVGFWTPIVLALSDPDQRAGPTSGSRRRGAIPAPGDAAKLRGPDIKRSIDLRSSSGCTPERARPTGGCRARESVRVFVNGLPIRRAFFTSSSSLEQMVYPTSMVWNVWYRAG